MINPNGDEFREAPQSPAQNGGGETATEGRWRTATGRWSDAAGNAWEQTKERAVAVREKTEFVLRENPVPTVIGALVLGLAIGLAIRYAYSSDEPEEAEVKTPMGNVNLGWLSLPFLWPFFKSVKRKAGEVADAAKEGVDRIKGIEVDDYVKPLRKKWRAWVH